MAPVTRSQTTQSLPGSDSSSTRDRSHYSADGQPPLYTVDLSLPPSTRYRQICQDYVHELRALTKLYDEVLEPVPSPRLLKFLARLLLRRVHSSEETKEIRGIAKEVGIELHLVVAYNTFLDLFSGCISGGVRASGGKGHNTRMLHFRGLDWDMEVLRKLIIRVEYVRDGKVAR